VTALTNSEIDNVCKRAAGLSHLYLPGWSDPKFILDAKQFDFFLNQYNTGLRFNEVWNVDRWSLDTESEFVCDTAKGSNNRTFSDTKITTILQSSADSETEIYTTCRYKSLSYWLKLVWAPYSFWLDNKMIGTHIFRHNLVRKMDDAGYKVAEIASYLGEVDTGNITGYLASKIYIN